MAFRRPMPKITPRRSSPPPRRRSPLTFSFPPGITFPPTDRNTLGSLPPSPPNNTPPPPLEVCVKAGNVNPDRIGDCPFCQRVLLTLEEKRIPYNLQLVTVESDDNGPNYLVPEGDLPKVKFDDSWVIDPEVIVRIIEERYPEPSLIPPPGFSSIGSNLYPTLVRCLRSREEEAERPLLSELEALDKHLKTNGPYVCGGRITSIDLDLAPKLYQVKVVLREKMPESFTSLQLYMKELFSRESFRKTRPGNEEILTRFMQSSGDVIGIECIIL